MNMKGDTPMTIRRTIRMDADVYEWIVALAKADRRSVSDVIRMILQDAKAKNWEP